MERESLKDLQVMVEDFTKKYNLGLDSGLRYVDLVSEMGELGKEILKGNDYGTKEFVKTDNLDIEFGDTLFSFMCLANSLDINLQDSLFLVLDKYTKRFESKGDIGSGN